MTFNEEENMPIDNERPDMGGSDASRNGYNHEDMAMVLARVAVLRGLGRPFHVAIEIARDGYKKVPFIDIEKYLTEAKTSL